MAQERIELRFSPGNPNERALIDALGAQGDEYGVKGRFLKERLLQGYAVLQREIEGFMKERDPMAALDLVAATVDAKHYRVLKVLLSDKVSEHGTAQPQVQQVSVAVAAPMVEQPIQPPAQPTQAVSEPAASASVAPAASVLPEADAAVVAAQVLTQVPEQQPEAEIEAQQPEHVEPASGSDAGSAEEANAAVEQIAPQPTRRYDWSSFAGIAGAKKGG